MGVDPSPGWVAAPRPCSPLRRSRDRARRICRTLVGAGDRSSRRQKRHGDTSRVTSVATPLYMTRTDLLPQVPAPPRKWTVCMGSGEGWATLYTLSICLMARVTMAALISRDSEAHSATNACSSGSRMPPGGPGGVPSLDLPTKARDCGGSSPPPSTSLRAQRSGARRLSRRSRRATPCAEADVYGRCATTAWQALNNVSRRRHRATPCAEADVYGRCATTAWQAPQ